MSFLPAAISPCPSSGFIFLKHLEKINRWQIIYPKNMHPKTPFLNLSLNVILSFVFLESDEESEEKQDSEKPIV